MAYLRRRADTTKQGKWLNYLPKQKGYIRGEQEIYYEARCHMQGKRP
jgi:hypothetical protein